MKKYITLILGVLSAVMLLTVCAQEKTTTYPLMGIASADPAVGGAPASYKDVVNPEQMQYYHVAHGGLVSMVRDIAKAKKYDTKAVVYTGGFTNYAPDVETRFRAAIAMCPMATLAADIDVKANVLVMNMGNDREFPFVASTADASSRKPDGMYCFWVRIGDEFMKVTVIDAVKKTITVERGFDKTQAASHSKGDRVFTPVYLGNRQSIGNNARHSNSWPGMEGIRYALDPANPIMHQFKAEFVIEQVKDGYSGIWWDTYQPFTYNLCDPLGRGDYGKDGKSLTYWNFTKNEMYTPETLREAMKTQMRAVRELTKKATGINPYLTANNISNKYEFMKSTLEPDVLLDGFCFEDAFIGPSWERGTVTNAKSAGGKGEIRFNFSPININNYRKKMEEMMQAARDGKETYSMIGPAGYVMAYFTPDQPNYEPLQRFGWCSFLLTVEKTRTTMFGKPITFTKNKQNKWEIVPLDEMYFYPIGNPSESKALKEYQVGEDAVWIRRFDKGIVIVSHLEDNKKVDVKLPAAYKDPKTGKKVERVTMSGADGAIFLK